MSAYKILAKEVHQYHRCERCGKKGLVMYRKRKLCSHCYQKLKWGNDIFKDGN